MAKGNRDATASWSGYIFQGEVALCRAIQKMVELDICPEYCLRLEENEDFSIHTETIEVFQVKANTKHNYPSYAEAWDKMMLQNPDTEEQNYLVIQQADFESERINVEQRADLISSNVKSGVYTLSNISEKLNVAITALCDVFAIPTDVENIQFKRAFCSEKISSYVKERHLTGKVREIRMFEILEWIREAPLILTEPLAKHELSKRFLDFIARRLSEFDLSIGEEFQMFENLKICYDNLERLPCPELHDIVVKSISPHRDLRPSRILEDFAIFIDENAVLSTVLNVVENINISNLHDKLQLINVGGDKVEFNQLTTDNLKYNPNLNADRIRLQSHLEKIKNNWLGDVDFFITEHISISKLDIQNEHLTDFMSVSESGDSSFGLKKVDDTIQEFS